MFWTLAATLTLQFAAPVRPVPTDSTPTCAQDLDALDQKVRADYGGFRLEIRGRRRTDFDRMLAALRPRAARATGDACFAVLQAYADFFADPHLFIYQSTRLDTAETARRAANAEHVALTADEAVAYFRRNAGRLDPIEGVWYAGGLRLAIVRDSASAPGRFTAVVLAGDTSIWAPGSVRAGFVRTPDGRYQGEVFERNYARRLVRAAIYKRLLLRLDPGIWGREMPTDAADSGLLDPVDPHRATLVVRDGVPVLSIPSHDPAYLPWLDSLLAARRDLLVHSDRLIVDLRGNEGGSSLTTAALMPYIVSDSQRPPYLPDRGRFADRGKGVMLSSPDQIAYAIRMVGGDTTDPSARRFLDRMRASHGGFALFADTLDPPQAARPVAPVYGPRRVGLLVDRGTVSAAEAFLVQAMRSTRVTTFGEPTAGALDYQNVSIVAFMPNEHRWLLGYPTITAHPDLPAGGVRGRGVRPDVAVDLARERDPIGRVAGALASAADSVNALLDGWHHAAAVADEAAYFGAMDPDAVYLGTDPGERWSTTEFREWARPQFARGSAWAFTPYDRHVTVGPGGDVAWADERLKWFDARLQTWMTGLRGSAVLRRTSAGWRVAHYDLSFTIPNDRLSNVVHLLRVSPALAPADARAIAAALRRLQEAGAAHDSARVLASLDAGARVVVVTGRDSGSAVEARTAAAYAALLARRQAAERDSVAELAVVGDEAIATVWAPFASYAGNTRTGCGVEELQLVKEAETWRITALAVRRLARPCGAP